MVPLRRGPGVVGSFAAGPAIIGTFAAAAKASLVPPRRGPGMVGTFAARVPGSLVPSRRAGGRRWSVVPAIREFRASDGRRSAALVPTMRARRQELAIDGLSSSPGCLVGAGELVGPHGWYLRGGAGRHRWYLPGVAACVVGTFAARGRASMVSCARYLQVSRQRCSPKCGVGTNHAAGRDGNSPTMALQTWLRLRRRWRAGRPASLEPSPRRQRRRWYQRCGRG